MTMKSKSDWTLVSYPAAVGSISTRILEAGDGPETVLFVHGLGARADRWANNLTETAGQGFRCLAIDLPGHGFAHKGTGFEYGVPGYAAFVGALLDQLHLDKVHLVGTSLGAHVVCVAACAQPERVQSLALVGAVGMLPIGAELSERIAKAIVDTSKEAIGMKLATVVHDKSLITEALLREEWLVNNSPGAANSFVALADYFRTGLDRDVIGARLADSALRERCLLAWGENDITTPLALGEHVGHLLKIALTKIPSAGHAPYWESPVIFNQILTAHLSRFRHLAA